LILGAVVVFVVKATVGAVFFGLLLDGFHDGNSPVVRPEGQERHGTGLVGELAWALAFSYLFAAGPRRRGWAAGLRFGLIVWCFYFVPMTLGVLGYFAVDTRWAIAALAVGLVEALLCGAAAAFVAGAGGAPSPA
jgi:hypothetical protein